MRDSPTEIFYSHTNPVEGWQNVNHDPSPAVANDYHAFLDHLKRDFDGQSGYLEDGKGQHAVTIEIARDGTYWTYVLIYDQNDKRIKVMKYISGHYMS